MTVWDNSAAPIGVPISASRIGVRIVLGGGTSTTCGGRFVACYDLGSSNGLLHVRGWSSAGSGTQPNPPLARDVRLFAGSCPDAYFSTATSSCSVGVSAVVDFGTNDPIGALGASVTAVIGGVTHPLTYDAPSGRWVSTGTNLFSVAPGAGPLPVELRWEETKGQVTVGSKLESCKVNGNKCVGTFGVVHRTFAGSEARSGAIKVAEVSEGGVAGANSFQLGANPNLVVRIAVAGNLNHATGVNDPLVVMRVTGSQNQSVDCDPDLPNLREEIRYGCAPNYAINTGSTCPATASALWATAQPWYCTAIQTGGAIGQVEQGLRDRINGGSNQCASPEQLVELPEPPDRRPAHRADLRHPVRDLRGERQRRRPREELRCVLRHGLVLEPVQRRRPRARQGLHRRALHQVRVLAQLRRRQRRALRLQRVRKLRRRHDRVKEGM